MTLSDYLEQGAGGVSARPSNALCHGTFCASLPAPHITPPAPGNSSHGQIDLVRLLKFKCKKRITRLSS